MSSIKIKSNFDLNKLSSSLVGEITKIGLYNSSEEAILQAREFAPYDSGTLKKSIGREPENISKKIKKVVVGPRKVDYAILREFKNKKNPDTRFYMKKTGKKVPDIAEEEFGKAVDIVLKRNGFI